MKAVNFSNVAVEALRVLPPLEPKDKSVVWARGSIRDAAMEELVVTGPKLPTIFSGCRYNNLVFAIHGPGADDDSHRFENFLHSVLSRVEAAVVAAPDKFRPGIKNTQLLQFDRDFIRPSSYSADSPNELRIKLAVKREYDDQGESVDMIETVFVDEEGGRVEPEDIRGGSEIIPIIRVSYYRNSNKFGLNMTMIKGLVIPGAPRKRTRHEDYEFDL